MISLMLDPDTVRGVSPSRHTILAAYTIIEKCMRLSLYPPRTIFFLVEHDAVNCLVLRGEDALHIGYINPPRRNRLCNAKPGKTFTFPCGCICRRLTDTEIAALIEGKQFNARYLAHMVDER